MSPDQKEKMVSRIYRTIRKRDILQRQLLDNDGNLSRETREWFPEFARFCHYGRSTAKVNKLTGMLDSHALALAEGRREAFLWLVERLHFTDENAVKMIEQINSSEE